MKQKSLKKNAIISFIKAGLNILFPIISFPYASRVLLPDGIGKVNFANSIIEYFIMFAVLGINLYAAREAARVRDDREKLSKFGQEILAINLTATFISYAALLVIIFFVPKFNSYRILLLICSTKVLFTTIGLEWLFNAEEEYGYITVRQSVFQLISLVALFTLVKTKDDYLIYAGIGVFSNVGSNIFNFIYSRKFIDLFTKTRLDFKRHIKPVLTFFSISIAGKINSALDSVMLGFMLTDASVGFYAAAIKISRLVKEMITSAICSFMPRTSYYLEHNKIDEYKAVVSKVCNATYFFSIPAATGLMFLSKPLILLFSGEAYLPAVPSMKVISLSIIGMCSTSFLNQLIITPQRKEKISLIAQIISAISNITLNAILITKLEVFGAALATTIVEFFLPLVLFISSSKFLRSFDNLIGILQALASSFSMYVILFFTCGTIENIIIQIMLSVVIGCFTYASVTLLLRNKTALFIMQILMKRLKPRNQSNSTDYLKRK